MEQSDLPERRQERFCTYFGGRFDGRILPADLAETNEIAESRTYRLVSRQVFDHRRCCEIDRLLCVYVYVDSALCSRASRKLRNARARAAERAGRNAIRWLTGLQEESR